MKTKKKRKIRKSNLLGFTLIELIVVSSILMIILAAIIATIDPFQQLAKAEDTNIKQAAITFINATSQYYSTQNNFPWDQDQNCKNELQAGGTLDMLVYCLNDLTNNGELKQEFITANNRLQKITVNQCGQGVMLCSNPLAKVNKLDPNTKYTSYGALDPNCPSTNDTQSCYWCLPLINDPECNQIAYIAPTVQPAQDMGGGNALSMNTPTLSPSPIQINQQVWVNDGYSPNYQISRFNLDGTPAGSPLSIGFRAEGMAMVGSQIWVGDYFSHTIYRFNADGNSVGNPITGTNPDYQKGITVVGSQVWVADGSYPNYQISRYNFDGTSAGSPLTGNNIYSPQYIAVVGSQVWITNGCGLNNYCILRFKFDGTQAGSPLMTGTFSDIGIAVVGSLVWVTGNCGPGNNPCIQRFNLDGTSAGSVLRGNGLDNPVDIAVVGSQVWVVNNYSSISRFNFDGTSAGSTLTGNGLSIPNGIVVIK